MQGENSSSPSNCFLSCLHSLLEKKTRSIPGPSMSQPHQVALCQDTSTWIPKTIYWPYTNSRSSKCWNPSLNCWGSFRWQIQIGSDYLINCGLLCDAGEYRYGPQGSKASEKAGGPFGNTDVSSTVLVTVAGTQDRFEWVISFLCVSCPFPLSLKDIHWPPVCSMAAAAPALGLGHGLFPGPFMAEPCLSACEHGCILPFLARIKCHHIPCDPSSPPPLLASSFSISVTCCVHSTHHNF